MYLNTGEHLVMDTRSYEFSEDRGELLTGRLNEGFMKQVTSELGLLGVLSANIGRDISGNKPREMALPRDTSTWLSSEQVTTERPAFLAWSAGKANGMRKDWQIEIRLKLC